MKDFIKAAGSLGISVLGWLAILAYAFFLYMLADMP